MTATPWSIRYRHLDDGIARTQIVGSFEKALFKAAKLVLAGCKVRGIDNGYSFLKFTAK